MKTEVEDLTDTAVMALEAEVTDLDRKWVTADRRVSHVSQHVEIPTTREQVGLHLIGCALQVHVEDWNLNYWEQCKNAPQKVQQLHIADSSIAKLSERFLLDQRLLSDEIDTLFHVILQLFWIIVDFGKNLIDLESVFQHFVDGEITLRRAWNVVIWS